jgi:UDP:flavonoid glycosyltransferase YjiC (YdhE family)
LEHYGIDYDPLSSYINYSDGKKVIYASFGTVVNGTLRVYYERVVNHIFTEAVEALRDRDDVQLILSEGCTPSVRNAPKTIAMMDALPGHMAGSNAFHSRCYCSIPISF